MDQNNTNKTILGFIILSIIVHGLIAYVITQTNTNKSNQDIQVVELANQTNLNNKSNNQIKKQAIPPKKSKKRTADKRHPKKTPRKKLQVNKPTLKKTNQTRQEKVLPTLPDLPPVEAKYSKTETSKKDSIVVSDENSKINLDPITQKDKSIPDEYIPDKPVSDTSMSMALQELPKATDSQNISDDLQEEVSTIQKELPKTSFTDLSGIEDEVSQLESVSGKQNYSPQDKGLLDDNTVPSSNSLGAVSQALSKGQYPTYQINQIHVIRPTSFKYPQASRRLKEEGNATLRMIFNEKGHPQKIDLVKSTGSIHLDKAALDGASTLRFKPLGHAFIYEFPVRFQLDFSDQQLNQQFDSFNPSNASENNIGKFKTKAQSLSP